ncbi:hypothetical protein CI109_101721 [Kwoniella shandongensis]|uniref:Uncharacterized protein n=1 Tax=Kwoniella shandongensis TaxID=1734106 RepID=A0A5M6CA94_9TREE|nr:uncharacterized protein CI109_001156 [Kwoniella shandongensis]KAA5530355.1 hypothetical protein CI109_001156 [Kwoniella shandongensis]
MAFITPLRARAIPSLAGPSRLAARSTAIARPVRWYSTPTPPSTPRLESKAAPGAEEVQPSLSDFISRERVIAAWQGLSLVQRLGFGLVVLLGGYFEYSLMKKYILDPVKAKKEAIAREAELKALEGGKGEVFLSEAQ